MTTTANVMLPGTRLESDDESEQNNAHVPVTLERWRDFFPTQTRGREVEILPFQLLYVIKSVSLGLVGSVWGRTDR